MAGRASYPSSGARVKRERESRLRVGKVYIGSGGRFHRDNAVISCSGTGNWLHVGGSAHQLAFSETL